MSPITRLAWWWLRVRGWAVQMNDPAIDMRNGEWRPLFTIRHGITPVYRIGPERIDGATRRRWAEPPTPCPRCGSTTHGPFFHENWDAIQRETFYGTHGCYPEETA